jgi:hypothetical protein
VARREISSGSRVERRARAADLSWSLSKYTTVAPTASHDELIAADRSGPHVPVGALLLCVAAAGSWGVGKVLVRVAQAPNAAALMVWSALVAPLPCGIGS